MMEIQNELDLIGKFKQDLEESKYKLGKLIISSQLEKAEARVTNLMADINANLVTQQITQLNSMDGNFHQACLWKVKNKGLPKTPGENIKS